MGFRLALCQPPVSGLEISSDTFGSLEPLIYLPERETATTGPAPLPDSSVGGGLLREDIQAFIFIIPLWIIPPIYLDLKKPPIDGGSPPSAELKIVDSRTGRGSTIRERRISHSGQAERNEAALLRSVEQLMAGGQKARGVRIRYASSHELV